MTDASDRIARVIRQFTSAADYTREQDFLTSRNGAVVLDTWHADWGSINAAAQAVDRLSTIFEDAGLTFKVKDQPTGPARDSAGIGLCWDNKPELSVEIPCGDDAETVTVRLETVAGMARKYNLPPRKFTAHF